MLVRPPAIPLTLGPTGGDLGMNELRGSCHCGNVEFTLFTEKSADDLSTYRFGHGTAQWIICSKCGVLTAVLCEIEGRLRAVVRVQSMVEHVFLTPEVLTDFESESVAERLARRARTWIGTVNVSPPLAQLRVGRVALPARRLATAAPTANAGPAVGPCAAIATSTASAWGQT